MNIPVYKLILSTDETTGVDFVSLVDKPAIMVNWHAFSMEENKHSNMPFSFKTIDNDKRIISGPLMIADKPILRQDEHGMYYAVFDADTIIQVVQRFFKLQNTDRVNLMHNDTRVPEGVYMFESFIVDSTRGIRTPDGFDTLPDGSWFGSYKIDNDILWESYIRTGRFNGFSIEGTFTMIRTDSTVVPGYDDNALIDLIVQELYRD